MDFLSTIFSPVVSIASKVLPLLLGGLFQDAKSSSQVYQIGNIAWYPHSGRLYAQNVGNNEASLQFSVVDAVVSGLPGAATTTTVYQPLPISGAYDATDDLMSLQDGCLTIGTAADASLPPELGGDLERAIAFGIKCLSLGLLVQLIGSVRISVKKDSVNGNYFIWFENTDPIPFDSWQILATVTNQEGQSVIVESIAAKHDALNESNNFSMNLPAGFDLSPFVSELTLDIKVPNSFYQEMTAERRRLVRMGMKLPQ